jgi:hypothetical protein
MVLNLAVNARNALSGQGKVTIETANSVLDEQTSRAFRATQFQMASTF